MPDCFPFDKKKNFLLNQYKSNDLFSLFWDVGLLKIIGLTLKLF